MPRWKVVYYDIDNRFSFIYIHARSESGVRASFADSEAFIGCDIWSIEREF